MAKKKIAALLIAAVVAAGGWALPARVSAAENDGTAVTWQQDETESSEQNSDEEAAVQEQSGTSENETLYISFFEVSVLFLLIPTEASFLLFSEPIGIRHTFHLPRFQMRRHIHRRICQTKW